MTDHKLGHSLPGSRNLIGKYGLGSSALKRVNSNANLPVRSNKSIQRLAKKIQQRFTRQSPMTEENERRNEEERFERAKIRLAALPNENNVNNETNVNYMGGYRKKSRKYKKSKKNSTFKKKHENRRNWP
jgi:hypothetical protein